ncbi:hydroxymethylglutaryl-CoA lyase [Gilvimarinus algae]|uniref:hydroxymethylglutaryl-CoA lyase n=1 Tax=Gilvimarinus algae TaxID=3058037 RepID=A0ABT8TIZ2_9GAMM|nr:hydroxymethylglutaryl-CoA lyase [Gilvimarinus sp. SDUM040014]MDO3383318.1 hydroxymethylglutaryl-CoA lyase [Gilvimarinus sp. SDUM040014]
MLPARVDIVEVGPRDGLQNEPGTIALADKLALIHALADAGLTRIEAGAFVNPKWVPQMADSEAVFAGIERTLGVRYSALTPNRKGFERAQAAGADEVAIFAAASEAFSEKNLNCSIAESLDRFAEVARAAREHAIPLRGYISCVLGCPYSGEVEPTLCLDIAQELLAMGCYEISLGDTIGVGTAAHTERLLEHLLPHIHADKLAVHMHDTYGQGLTNIYRALQMGIAVVDSSVAGLGGCPYAKGASGNVATEDVLYLLNGLGIEHGADLHKVMHAGARICERLNKSNNSRAAKALLSKP